MHQIPFLDHLRAVFAQHGPEPYGGEAVTQMEHALQTAALAEANGASDAMVVAALLHDLGHMIADPQLRDPANADDLHQFRALPVLRRELPDTVTEPIRLHVDAKRYLCAVDPDYLAGLSPVSVNSLRLQGGVYSTEEAGIFIKKPHAVDAVRLRTWDDCAKVPSCPTPSFEHFLSYVERTIHRRA